MAFRPRTRQWSRPKTVNTPGKSPKSHNPTSCRPGLRLAREPVFYGNVNLPIRKSGSSKAGFPWPPPCGNPAKCPPLPHFHDLWQLGKPDPTSSNLGFSMPRSVSSRHIVGFLDGLLRKMLRPIGRNDCQRLAFVPEGLGYLEPIGLEHRKSYGLTYTMVTGSGDCAAFFRRCCTTFSRVAPENGL